jgi:hypothetical protein
VALAAGFLGIVDRGTGVHLFVGECLLVAVRVAAVAVFTAKFAVVGKKKFFGNEDLFLRFQRNHLTASAGAGLQVRCLDFVCAEILYQHGLIEVTGDTTGPFFCVHRCGKAEKQKSREGGRA